MQNFRKSKLLVGTATALMVLVFAISATFAWFTAKDDVTNHMETERFTNGDVKILETWDPGDGIDWKPGTELNKDAGAVNTGKADALVRMSFEEVLSKLLNGIPVNMSTGWVANQTWTDTATSTTYDLVAQTTNITAYTGWTVLAAGDPEFTSIVDASSALTTTGLTIVYKVSTVAAPSGGTKKVYNFAAYYALGGGIYQKVDLPQANVVFTPGATPTNVLTIGAPQYQALAMAPTSTIDWLTATNRPATDIATGTIGNPPANHLYTWALTDAGNKYISLIFNNSSVITVLDTVTPANNLNKWWYNEDDGWFYYIGKLASGATSANLLDAMYLDAAAGAEYNGMSFDLKVKMEAVQSVQDAITAASGWGKVAANADTIALIAALTAVNAF